MILIYDNNLDEFIPLASVNITIAFKQLFVLYECVCH